MQKKTWKRLVRLTLQTKRLFTCLKNCTLAQKNEKHFLISILFFILIQSSLYCQDDCFKKLYSAGEEKFMLRNYQEAKRIWSLALKCSDLLPVNIRQLNSRIREVNDDDGDNIINLFDKCPNDAGLTPTGCPSNPDKDYDGIPDAQDRCPDFRGPNYTQGCPDPDFDSIPYPIDRCPLQFGHRTCNGCPDQDRDSISDVQDRCPNQFGLVRYDGCPDSDSDEVPDHLDSCPKTEGNLSNGCLCETPTPRNMVLVKGGDFKLDSLEDSNGRFISKHYKVKDFFIATYETTFEEYDNLRKSYPDLPKTIVPDWDRGKHPVIYVTWRDVIMYCNFRSIQEKLSQVYTIKGDFITIDSTANGYRLPTELEWEYAATERGKNILLGNGMNIANPTQINYDKSGFNRSVEVGRYMPNQLGLYDMSGNVWELVDGSYRLPIEERLKIIKGGAWRASAQSITVKGKMQVRVTDSTAHLGFRLARSIFK
ncbi:MAG: SUMF1/EgtB/PvdO family nonheme iron enzyme [Haliscomenobacter sp.]|uniref:formylglycine-generating enzyme family protein n=1 Tax=Haliscomenobacter sp. TaxID=2717303 RepID=UPI0029BD167B|nr:SUMF1/EgtB/PvdO family nonheme iron enzyme [Haliscomenobacter sp.]MDX2067329.1 SUMF1/EgtB/PvdO family nonheme iron enzyme [Haliscomenobacter sp.]